MSKSAMPILLLGGGALLLMSGKKKKKSPSSSDISAPQHDASEEENSSENTGIPEEEVSEEDDLEGEDENSGSFETDESKEDVDEEEDFGDEDPDSASFEGEAEDPEVVCEKFMTAVHVNPQSEDEAPISEVAVSESVLPAMNTVASSIKGATGEPLDEEKHGPALVLEGLRALVPGCEWGYNEQDDFFFYNDGKMIETDTAKDVLFGLIKISSEVIKEQNLPDTGKTPSPKTGSGGIQMG